MRNKTPKKILSFSLFIVVFLFLVFLPSFVSAGLGDIIKKAIMFLPYLFLAVVLCFIMFITFGIAWLASFILGLVISPVFINLSYVNPAKNPIIKAGFTVTQSFINFGLVIALVYIALCIALRWRENDAKSILVRLIIVALFANFIWILCAVVVDATNIVIDSFLRELQGKISSGFTDIIKPFLNVVAKSVMSVGSNIADNLGVLMMVATMIAVNISLAIAFLFYAAIFFMRYIAIWVLVILSPVAVALWIFPPGKARRLWDAWIQQFIEWSIIGIPLAFFLFLAISTLSISSAMFINKIEMAEQEMVVGGILNKVLPFFVVIAFLFFGFGVALQSSATGAGAIIEGAKAAFRTGQSVAFRGAGRAIKKPFRWAGGLARTPRDMTRKIKEKMGEDKKLSVWGAFKKVAKETGKEKWQSSVETIKSIPSRIPKAGSRVLEGIYSGIKDTLEEGTRPVKLSLGIYKKRERVTCSKCGSVIPESAKVCPYCGMRRPTCLNCGHLLLPGANWCHHCGVKVGERTSSFSSSTSNPSNPSNPPNPPNPPPSSIHHFKTNVVCPNPKCGKLNQSYYVVLTHCLDCGTPLPKTP